MSTQLDISPGQLAGEALDLLAKLWPAVPGATVHVETHDWERLRRVLTEVPDLAIKVELLESQPGAWAVKS